MANMISTKKRGRDSYSSKSEIIREKEHKQKRGELFSIQGKNIPKLRRFCFYENLLGETLWETPPRGNSSGPMRDRRNRSTLFWGKCLYGGLSKCGKSGKGQRAERTSENLIRNKKRETRGR